jgi:hypothetical protein
VTTLPPRAIGRTAGIVASRCHRWVPPVNSRRAGVKWTGGDVWGAAGGGIIGVMDQHLLELAIRACGGELALARALETDIPAIDWWRRAGVPDEMYSRIRAVTVDEPPAPPLPPR